MSKNYRFRDEDYDDSEYLYRMARQKKERKIKAARKKRSYDDIDLDEDNFY